MSKKILIAPSILTIDYLRIQEEIQGVEHAGIDCWHLDIMDGHFVPQISFGHDIVKQIMNISQLPIEVHLMVNNPTQQAKKFLDINVHRIIVHIESIKDPQQLINQTHSLDKEFALAINPDTSVNMIQPYLNEIDQVTIMTVNPGLGGQAMIFDALNKIEEIKQFMKDKNIDKDINFEIDGGVKEENLEKCISAGANILVMGSAIFNKDQDRQRIIKRIRKNIQS
jgi:ribulose-phosphate 3-epimerase